VYSEAVQLAKEYWELSASDNSSDRYTLSRLIRELNSTTEDLEAKKAEIKLRCDRFGINFKEAIQSPSRVKISKDKSVPHLLKLKRSNEVIRLAVFMLLVKEYAAHWIAFQDIDNLFSILARVKDAAGNLDEIDFESDDEDMNELLKIVKELGLDQWTMEEILKRRRAVHDYDMVQRLEPLPEKLLTDEGLDPAGRLYPRLTGKGINLDSIINDEDATIEPDERQAVQYFALEMGFPQSEWAEWLRKNYVR
jgi:hypothetical protein